MNTLPFDPAHPQPWITPLSHKIAREIGSVGLLVFHRIARSFIRHFDFVGAMPSHVRACSISSKTLTSIPRFTMTVSPNLAGSTIGSLKTNAKVGESELST